MKRNQKSHEIDPSEICLTKKQKLLPIRNKRINEFEDEFRNGTITYIHLKNFMAHREFEWIPGPRVNVVTGIGKSSIINAIRIGLGFGYDSNELKKYVRKGASEAVITIHL